MPEEEIRNVIAQLAASDDAEDTEGTLGDQLREYFMPDALRHTLLRLMRKRFGELPESAPARLKAADRATLELWLDRILTATTLDEVWAES